MTQANERTATLSELVAEEIRALMARRRMSGRQLSKELGVSPSWVSYRLTGTQPIDINDLGRIAKALDVSVYDLLPSREVAAGARFSLTEQYLLRHEQSPPVRPSRQSRPRDNRPSGHPASPGIRRSSLLPRPPYGRAT